MAINPEINNALTESPELLSAGLELLPRIALKQSIDMTLVYGTSDPLEKVLVECCFEEGFSDRPELNLTLLTYLPEINPEILRLKEKLFEKIEQEGVRNLSQSEIDLLWTDDDGQKVSPLAEDILTPKGLRLPRSASQSWLALDASDGRVVNYDFTIGEVASDDSHYVLSFSDQLAELQISQKHMSREEILLLRIFGGIPLDEQHADFLASAKTFTPDRHNELLRALSDIQHLEF